MKIYLALSFVLLASCNHTLESGQPQIAPGAAGSTAADADDIESMVKPKLSDLSSCYKIEQRSSPKAAGKVMLGFTVLKDGRTGDVRLLASTLKSPVMEGCLVGKIESWLFTPPTQGREIKVRYPFSFQP